MEKGHYSVLRVSHLSQIDNFSIEQQRESIETYARFHSIEITEHLAECGSGTTDERKQIQTLYRLIEEDYELPRTLNSFLIVNVYIPDDAGLSLSQASMLAMVNIKKNLVILFYSISIKEVLHVNSKSST